MNATQTNMEESERDNSEQEKDSDDQPRQTKLRECNPLLWRRAHPAGAAAEGKSEEGDMGLFKTTYLLPTLTNYDVKLRMDAGQRTQPSRGTYASGGIPV
ncbi:unnamed protein product [Boreogadus saida]